MNPQAPLIVIGAGRSGTTLLGRMLGGHPAIDFKGETAFLSARLWLEAWHDRFWLNWAQYNHQQPRSSCEPMPAVGPDLLAVERARAGAAVAAAVAGVLGVDPARPCWGFKEIWNGHASRSYPWADYDAIYPEARWLHLVRHPVDFARSCAQWSRQPLTEALLAELLGAWVRMVRYNRERAASGRYAELRYEDLRARPEEALTPALGVLGLAFDERCLVALGTREMASRPAAADAAAARAEAADLAQLATTIEGLDDLMATFGYRLPEAVELATEDGGERPAYCDLHDPFGDAANANGPQHALLLRLQAQAGEIERLRAALRAAEAAAAPAPQGGLARSVQRLLRRG
jgi:hypothetical protein